MGIPILQFHCIPIMSYNIKNTLVNHGFNKTDDTTSIYLSLYDSIKKAIINRVFGSGFRLPATRVLAKDLDVSRSTVVKAYDLLALEKYTASSQGSGHYVTSTQTKKSSV